MAATERHDPGDAPTGRRGRELPRPPGERYVREGEDGRARGIGASLTGPLARALVAGAAGAGLLFVVGAVLASTAGLLLLAGLTGGAIGLLLARAAAPSESAGPALSRRGVTWLAIGLSLAALAVGAIATWLFALGEGGTLGLADYLLETFGLFIPGEVVVAVIGAAWGARAGPVER